jgi:UDP-glucose 4-epimerase
MSLTGNYLVTGGAGFIGSHIAAALAASGARVRVIDDLSTGYAENLEEIGGRVEFVRGSLLEAETLRRALEGVEVVFHEAAIPSVPRSVEDPAETHRACAEATFALLLAARAAGVRRLVYAASSSCYGDQPTLPKVEDMRPDPLSPYAAAKLVGEYYCQVWARTYGFETVCLRYFNVFGPRQDPLSPYAAVIPRFITAFLEDRPPTVYGDGEQSRDFTYVDNAVEATLRAADAPVAGGAVFNVACGERTSLNALLDELRTVSGKQLEAAFLDSRPGDVQHSLADIGPTCEALGYDPQVDVREGLRRTYEHHLELRGAGEPIGLS